MSITHCKGCADSVDSDMNVEKLDAHGMCPDCADTQEPEKAESLDFTSYKCTDCGFHSIYKQKEVFGVRLKPTCQNDDCTSKWWNWGMPTFDDCNIHKP